ALLSSDVDSKRSLCERLPAENPRHKFYYSLTLGQQNISGIKDQLYVVGLASHISKDRIDNIARIRENLENRFLLDNLTVDFSGESEFAAGRVLSANYLVPMLLLYEHYGKTGDTEKMKRWEPLITRLAEEKGKTTLVKNFLGREKTEATPFVAAGLDAGYIEGHLRIIKGNIYAYDMEVTNAEYNKFLNFLLENQRNSIYETSKFDLSQYTEPAYTYMRTYHANTVVTKKNKYFTQYPAVNIPFDGAQAYCDWLTEQYNNLAGRKFKKVKFRLPTVNEWQIAALGYKKFQSWNIRENNVELAIPENSEDELCKGCPVKTFSFEESGILYPWYGAYNYRHKALNKRGCALGNFKFPETHPVCRPQMPTPDGWTLMAPVGAYFPNNIGLYDVVGNVAEMTAEKGKACGGSWNHTPEESTILSINEYKGPDSAIGFRPFMEVIEK
ncbi:MAG TPA: SUMF1/EgtB/PvdO family nonheme iron enzyme, partial [Chryseosolibacter sp.]|nr:SUMF1/EgtB/PvdO family nonheme iron enzyme [Chryseosolibacter sp.]